MMQSVLVYSLSALFRFYMCGDLASTVIAKEALEAVLNSPVMVFSGMAT